jgi:hypothetical protein
MSKRKRKFMSKDAIARAGKYNSIGPLMLRIYGPGGVAVPARSALERVDLDEVADVEVPETVVQDLEETRVQDLVEAHDSDSESISTDSDDEDGQQAAARVAAARVAKAASLSRLQEDISDPNMSFAQIAKKELETDDAEEETHQHAELDVAKPVEPVDNDRKGDKASTDAGSMIGQISSQLRANTLRNKVAMEHINVNTDWNLCNSPDSEGLILCPPHLVDAHIFDVETWRTFVGEAYAVTRMFDNDTANKAMPPPCELIGHLRMCKNAPYICEDEIEVMTQYDGLLTYDLEGDFVIAATIGFYAMPVLREISQHFQGGLRLDVVETDAGYQPGKRKNMQIFVLGDFLRHADIDSKAFNRRAKAVHDLHVKYDKGVEDHGPADCLDEVLSDPLVRGFLHEGAADVCHQSRITALSGDHKHFYPEGQPTTKAEFLNNVRSVQDILENPWFATENGRPSFDCAKGNPSAGVHVDFANGSASFGVRV